MNLETNSDLDYRAKPESYFEGARPEMLEFIPTNAQKILEVGCAGGGFGQLIKKRQGSVVWGIEPSHAASFAKQRLDVVINDHFSGQLDALAGNRFDVVIFNDVLEHSVHPERLLEEAKLLLADDGVVVASIPNILFFPVIWEILIEEDWLYRDSGTLDSTHLRFFTRKSINRLFGDCGYRVDTLEGINADASSRLYRALNFLFLGRLADWKYLQFAVIARVASGA